MKVGETVIVFTASGTYRGVRGVVVRAALGGAFVQLEGEGEPLLFTARELVPASDRAHLGGAE